MKMNSEAIDDVERCKDIDTIKRLIIEYEQMFIGAKKRMNIYEQTLGRLYKQLNYLHQFEKSGN